MKMWSNYFDNYEQMNEHILRFHTSIPLSPTLCFFLQTSFFWKYRIFWWINDIEHNSKNSIGSVTPNRSTKPTNFLQKVEKGHNKIIG